MNQARKKSPVADVLAGAMNDEAKTTKDNFLSSLDSMVASTPTNLSEMKERARDAVFLLPGIALAGQLTVINASYSTGKTLLTMWLLSTRNRLATKDFKFLYINADDDFNGGISKGELLESFGVQSLIPNECGFDVSMFAEIINGAIDAKAAGQLVFILDTMKKFVNMMDKGGARDFTDLLRRFSQAGGSVIALAHTNKHKGHDGKSVAEGVGDFLNDFDCAYIADIAAKDDSQKTVVFKNNKVRGTNEMEITFTYSNRTGSSWLDRFESVKKQAGSEAKHLLDDIKAESEYKEDLPIIHYLEARLASGKKNTSQLTKEDLTEANPSRTAREKVLRKYNQSNANPKYRLWTELSGKNGSKNYETRGLGF